MEILFPLRILPCKDICSQNVNDYMSVHLYYTDRHMVLILHTLHGSLEQIVHGLMETDYLICSKYFFTSTACVKSIFKTGLFLYTGEQNVLNAHVM